MPHCSMQNKIFGLFLMVTIQFMVTAQVADFTETLPSVSIQITNNPNSFDIPLDYEPAFVGYIKTTPENKTNTLCTFHPSLIKTSFTSAQYYSLSNTWYDAPNAHDYQIEYYSSYPFVSKFTSFSFDYKISPGPGVISLDATQAAIVGTVTSKVFMFVDPATSYLYLINNNHAYSYNLNSAIAALTATVPTTPADISNVAFTPSFTNIQQVKFYSSKAFIVTTDAIYVYQTVAGGTLTLQTQYDSTTFGVAAGSLNLADIAFKGDYAFVLDTDVGVYPVLISTGVYQSALKIDRLRGKYIEVANQVLLIIGETTSLIYEYFLVGSSPITSIEYNEYLKSYYPYLTVKQTQSDDNFFYLVTPEYVILSKHSIPSTRFPLTSRSSQEKVLLNGRAIKALPPTGVDSSNIIVLESTSYASVYSVSTRKSYLNCFVNEMPGCKYNLRVRGVTKTCPSKSSSSSANDPRVACIKDKTIELVLLNSDIPCPDPSIAAPNPLYQNVNVTEEKKPEKTSSKNKTEEKLNNNGPKEPTLQKPEPLKVENNATSNSPVNTQEKNKESPKVESSSHDQTSEEKVKEKPPQDIPKIIPHPPKKTESSTTNTPPIIKEISEQAPNVTTKPEKEDQVPEKTKPEKLPPLKPQIPKSSPQEVPQKAEKENSTRPSERGDHPSQKPQQPQTSQQIIPSKTKEISIDEQKVQVDTMMQMMNQNNKMMNALIMGFMVLFVVVIVFIGVALWCSRGRGWKKLEEEENSQEEEKPDFVVSGRSRNRRIEKGGQEFGGRKDLSATFADESKIDIENNISRLGR